MVLCFLARNNLGLFHTCNRGPLAALIRHFPNPVGGGGRERASERERGLCKRACARKIVRERVGREGGRERDRVRVPSQYNIVQI